MTEVPPQNLEAEEAVLGAMLLSSSAAVGTVSELLSASDFYRGSHGLVFGACVELWGRGEPVDPITVADLLEQRGELERAGGRARLAELAALVSATANVAHYARIVRDAAVLRGLVGAGLEIARLGREREGEPQVLVDEAERLVFELATRGTRQGFRRLGPVLTEMFDGVRALYESGGELTGVPSGFRELDRLTAGFQPGNLVIVAARPSIGKSAFALGLAGNLAVRHNVPVAVFSLEMSALEVAERLVCIEGRLELSALRAGRLQESDWPRLAEACRRLEAAPVHYDDEASVTLAELRSRARRLKMREPALGLVLVDYLQLLSTGRHRAGERVQEVSEISRGLKMLARDLDVPVVAVSQLSRQLEQRADKRPILSDLRDSGAIEQDADMVVFLYRDEYHNPDTTDKHGVAEVILAKNRNGPTGRLELAFVQRCAAFSELAVA